MTVPKGSLQDFEEAVDAALDLGMHIKEALADGRVTLDEIVSGVSDGQIRASLKTAVEAIQKHNTMSPWDLLNLAASALLELMAHLRDALADGHITADDLVFGVTDGHVKESLVKAFEGASNIPTELKNVGPWDMIRIVQRIMTRLAELLDDGTSA